MKEQIRQKLEETLKKELIGTVVHVTAYGSAIIDPSGKHKIVEVALELHEEEIIFGGGGYSFDAYTIRVAIETLLGNKRRNVTLRLY